MKMKKEKESMRQTILFVLFLSMVMNASFIYELSQQLKELIIVIAKILITLLFFLLSYPKKPKLPQKILFYMIFLDRFLELIMLILIRIPNGFFLATHLCYSIEISNDIKWSKETLAINLIGKLGLILQTTLLDVNPLPIVCSIIMILLDIFYYIKLYKRSYNSSQSLQVQLNSVRSSPNQCLKGDYLWRQRIEDMNLQVLILSQPEIKRTYMNQCFLTLFDCNSKDDLEQILMGELHFQIPQQFAEIYKKNSLSIRRIRPKTQSLKDDLQNIESTKQASTLIQVSLRQILSEYTKGSYDEIINNSNKKSLEIYCCHKNANDQTISLSGQIISDGCDITIFLNDISKQAELSQQKVKDDFKSKIIESFSHEMKTPLNSAKNLIESAIQERNISNKIKDDLLKPAFNSLKLQSYIINDIIDFQNFYANSLYLQMKDFSFQELINEISSLFQLQFEMKNMGFKIINTKNMYTWFNTDYNRLLQVVVNLLSNAIKFSNSGNVEVKFKSFDNNCLKITIKDEGIGIKQENLEIIKNTLNQFLENDDFTTNKKWHGFGLLVSQILLSKISPSSQKQLLQIKSSDRGTKISFEIENQSQGQSVQISRKSVRASTKIHSMNRFCIGTVIVTQVRNKNQFEFEQNLTPQFNKMDQTENIFFSQKSIENDPINQKLEKLNSCSPKFLNNLNESSSSDSGNDFNFQQPIFSSNNDAGSIQPIIKDQKSVPSSRSLTLDVKKLYIMEDHESQQNLIQFVQKKKCQCKKILSVDDEIFNQHSICMLISKLGFEVLTAFNGSQALELISKLQKCCENCQLLDLILMDYQMPILNGVETTKKLLHLMRNSVIPFINIIGLTAFTAEEDIRKCLDAGMFDVLSKPLNLKEFKELLSIL